jgi:hypothetical protein
MMMMMMNVRAILAVLSIVGASVPALAAAAPVLAKPATSAGAATTAAAAPSNDCGGSHAIDRCLVGTWEMTVDGALEYVRSKLHGAKVNVVSQVGNTMALNADGTFATGEARTTATADKAGMHVESTSVGQASGRWAATGGKVNYCATSIRHEATTTLTIGGKKTVVPTKPVGPTVATYTYTCSGDKLTQVIQVGKTGTMTSAFKRLH